MRLSDAGLNAAMSAIAATTTNAPNAAPCFRSSICAVTGNDGIEQRRALLASNEGA